MEAIVDPDNYDWINQYTWHYTNMGYACRQSLISEGLPKRPIMMHRQIMETPKGMFTDHINHNKLDNRRENLRICDTGQNRRNAIKHCKSISKYKGVTYKKRMKRWLAAIAIDKKDIHLGVFDNEIDAARAYNEAAIKYHGEFAYINVI